MFVVNEDLSIYATRGDIVSFYVKAQKDGEDYLFQSGNVVRIKVCEKKACENVVLQKDFGVETETDRVLIYLEEKDTRIGGIISKPVDYWYEIELNPFDDPQTIIGYDDDGPKVFKLMPESRDLEDDDIEEEDIPFVDTELDMTSRRPVENQAIARQFAILSEEIANSSDKVTSAVESANATNTAMSAHLTDHDNPHKVNAFQVGARPNTWMPTASEVGARPNTWMPTASDVGATPASHATDTNNPHKVTASQIGARPSDWMPTAAEVGATPLSHASNTSNPHKVTASQVGAVPTSRTINGKVLNANITLTASDVGATPASHANSTNNPHGVTASQIGAVPTSRTVNGKALSGNVTLDADDVGAAPLINIGAYSGDLDSLDIQLNSVAWIVAGSCTNCPTGNYAVLETWGSSSGTRVQRLTTISGPTAQRSRVNGSWTEWEWINAPLTVGVVYRTIERWNAKAVYSKVINCGTLVDGRKLVEDSTLGGCVVIDAKGYVTLGSSNYYHIPSIYDTTDSNVSVVTTVNTTATVGNIHIWGGSEFVGKTAYVMVKYFRP